MSVFKGTVQGGNSTQTLASRTWLSTNLQTTDDRTYDPTTPLQEEPVSATHLFSITDPLFHSYNGSVIGSSQSAFYQGLHYTIDTVLYDGQEYQTGTIISDLLFFVDIQNMYGIPKQVTSVSITSGQNVTFTGISAATVFNPYEEIRIDVTVEQEGSLYIEATLEITLEDDPNTYFVTFIGFRFYFVKSFVLSANWGEGLSISRRHLTSVFKSVGTGETRKILRKTPMLNMDAVLSFLSDDAATQAWQFLRARASGQTIIPLFPDEQSMTQTNDAFKLYCDTSYRRYVDGGLVMAIKYDKNRAVIYYDIFQIVIVEPNGLITKSEVTNVYEEGDYICPAILCYPAFGEDVKTNMTQARGTISLTAEEVYGRFAVGKENPTYTPDEKHGIPVFNFRINEIDGTEIFVSYQGESKSSGRGFKFFSQGTLPYMTQTIKVFAETRALFWEITGFFNKLKGRGKPFWIRNNSDFIQPILEGTGYIELGQLEISDWTNVSYLWVEDTSGMYDIVEVTGVIAGSQGVRINFNAPSVTPVKYYQALAVRLDSDEVVENWLTASIVEISFKVRELQGWYSG